MKKQIFDNSNLAESYSGVTTPLTFSFAKYVYQHVYRHFCGMMGVGKKKIDENETLFPNMLAFIGYRMYYNLINWYKLVSFLPGYKFNKNFLEQMLGVQKEYNYHDNKNYNLFKRIFIDLPRLVFQSLRITVSFVFMSYQVKKFNRYFDNVFKDICSIELSELTPYGLRDLYFDLDKRLIFHWRIPIVNDFAVMVSTGMADKFYRRWLNNNDFYFYLHMKSHNPLIALDPGLQIEKIVTSIRVDPTMLNLFRKTESPDNILKTLQKEHFHNPTSQLISDYIKKFGGRSPNELKLESETLNEKPEFLIVLIKNLIDSSKFNSKGVREEEKFRPETYQHLRFFKKWFLDWLLSWAINSIERREETRFRRALIFDYVRKIFLATGQKFYQEGLLNNPRDIFYLTIEEVFNCIESKNTERPVEIVLKRKQELLDWHLIELPRRIEIESTIEDYEREFMSKARDKVHTNAARGLKGFTASRPAGMATISGKALTLKDFDPNADFSSKILVTRQTDPGWTIVFPVLKGLIVERGGILSHAAIIARELNIPCIIGVESATEFIKNDSQIQMNLDNGEVSFASL